MVRAEFGYFVGRAPHTRDSSPQAAEFLGSKRPAIVSWARAGRADSAESPPGRDRGREPPAHLGGAGRTFFVRIMFSLHYTVIRASDVLAECQVASVSVDAATEPEGVTAASRFVLRPPTSMDCPQ